MPLFETHVVVDWSARSKPSPVRETGNAIWLAMARHGALVETAYFRTRHDAVAELTELIASELGAGRRVLVGFDFPFGYPAGVVEHLTGQGAALALWEWLAGRVEDDVRNANNRFHVATEINRRFPGVGPFWGRPKSWRCHPDVPTCANERTCRGSHPAERRIADRHATGAKTVWQLFYSGSVGSQVLLGLPALARLRNAPSLCGRTAVWPFEGGLRVPDKPIILVEVYPSLLRDAIKTCEDNIQDRVQVRVNARAFATLDAAGGLSALFQGPSQLTASERRIVETEEGWILGLDQQQDLYDALERVKSARG